MFEASFCKLSVYVNLFLSIVQLTMSFQVFKDCFELSWQCGLLVFFFKLHIVLVIDIMEMVVDRGCAAVFFGTQSWHGLYAKTVPKPIFPPPSKWWPI